MRFFKKNFAIVTLLIATYHLFCGIYSSCAQDDAVSARHFTEGKSWTRIIEIFVGKGAYPKKKETVTVLYKVIRGYSEQEQSQDPDEIVIEINNPAVYEKFNPYRVVLSPKGVFKGYMLLRDGTWYYSSKHDAATYELPVHIETDDTLLFYYVFLKLPVLWKDSTFYSDDLTEIITRVENNTLKVLCRKFDYQTMNFGNEERSPTWEVNKDVKELSDEIQIVFEKGDPWAASIKSQRWLKLESP
ncbi:MAG: hypothetical protein GY795_50085 [Desulfobacterales bacterium]|nr:hypothetical protein [Desulfobacterales bacterium]